MDATRRGDDRRQEGVTQAWGRVALPIFINLHLSPLIEREIKVLMAQGANLQGNQLAPTIANDDELPGRSLAEDAWADGHVVGDSLCSDHCCVSGSGERVRKRDRGQHG